MSRLNNAQQHPMGAERAQNQSDRRMASFGRLSMLASYCPLHKKLPVQALSRLFIPAINNDTIRFFTNDDDQVCAALIWARLSDEVSQRMIYDQVPPTEKDWTSGTNLWTLDILAPFGHSRMVARHIARTPHKGPFYFARGQRWTNPQGGAWRLVSAQEPCALLPLRP